MFFSVLMSLYEKERPEFLRLSLDSVFSQTLVPSEVILVLDGPITTALQSVVNEYASKHSELNIIPLANNVGLGSALNEGLKYCSHDLVLRMDTDDISKPHRFETQVKFMIDHPEIAACSSWIDEFIDNIENVVSIKYLPETHEEIYEYGKSRCPINHPTAIYRKSAVIKAQGYGPFPEDYYLWGRMLANGDHFYNIQESLLWFRTSPQVYKRRGGAKYLKAILKVYRELLEIHYISRSQYTKLLFIRTAVSLIPNSFRAFLYKNFLRKSIRR